MKATITACSKLVMSQENRVPVSEELDAVTVLWKYGLSYRCPLSER